MYLKTNKKIYFPFRKLSFYYHLNELKLRLFYIILCLLVTFLVCYLNSEKIIYLLYKPLLTYIETNNSQMFLHSQKNNNSIDFIFIDIYEAFYVNIFISFFCSFYLILPIFIYQIYSFFIPSIYNKKKIYIILNFLTFIFLLYLFIFIINSFLLEKLFEFFLNFTINNIINVSYMPRLKSYIILYTKIIFFSSFIGILPFIFFFFVKKYEEFFKNIYINRFKTIFFILIVSSIIVPPDIILQILLTLFFSVFLEICILLFFIFRKFTEKI